MQLDALSAAILAWDLNRTLRGCVLTGTLEPGRNSLLLFFSKGEKKKTLRFFGDPGLQLLFLEKSGRFGFKQTKKHSGPFSERLTRATEGSVVCGVSAACGDRIIIVHLHGRFHDTGSPREMDLCFYLTGSGANVILWDSLSGKRICSIRKPGQIPPIDSLLLTGMIPPLLNKEIFKKQDLVVEGNKFLTQGSIVELATLLQPYTYGKSPALAMFFAAGAVGKAAENNSDISDIERFEKVLSMLSELATQMVKTVSISNVGSQSWAGAITGNSLPGGGLIYPVSELLPKGINGTIVTGRDLSELQIAIAASKTTSSPAKVTAIHRAQHGDTDAVSMVSDSARHPSNLTTEGNASYTQEQSSRILTLLRKLRKKTEQRLRRQNSDLAASTRAEQFREIGNLLLAQKNNIPAGIPEITLDRLKNDESTITVPLDRKKNIVENAKYYFKKARKLENSIPIVKKRIAFSQTLLGEINELIESIKNLSPDDNNAVPILRKASNLLRANGFYDGEKIKEPKDGSGFQAPSPWFRRFILDDKWELLIGKNAAGNDRLTFGTARPRDIWMHAQGATGSHGIIRVPDKNSQIPKHILEKAAAITAFFSTAKHSALVPVMYTERRFVRKIRHAPPGSVSPMKVKTLFVEPSPPPSHESNKLSDS